MSSRGDKINLMSGYMPSNITQGGNKYMANVMFKRGLHSALFNTNGTPKITVNDGTFYLTTDTHRLYVGQGNQMVPVNEGVTTVTNVAALQNIIQDSETNAGLAGSFYYATAENILCV